MTNDNSNVIVLAELRAAREEAEAIPQDRFGDGPWKYEPNYADSIDRDTGYPCAIIRHPELGHLCGYVGVPNTHRAWAKDYGDILLNGISVHGGLNYSSFRSLRPQGLQGRRRLDVVHPGAPWWFGFDCAHAGDIIPVLDVGVLKKYRDEMEAELISLMAKLGPKSAYGSKYRTFAWVAGEVGELAAQLKELE